MTNDLIKGHSIGWIGTGRMGYAMAGRLLKAGADVSVYNRTRSKAEPLTELGATIVDSPADLADRDIVFTMVSGPDDLKAVTMGEAGVLSVAGTIPGLLIDCSSVSEEASAHVRAHVKSLGGEMLAAPVSGNAKVVKAGKLSIVASGPEDAFNRAEPYLAALGEGATYVGGGELARMVKICHNILLGVVTQSLAEIAVLAEKGGVPRHALMDFINKSVMGCRFSKYKTPSIVNLDFTPTFTPVLLRKDLDLGLAAGAGLGVPLPVTQLVRDLVQRVIDDGGGDEDFMVLLRQEARDAGLDIQPENLDVGDGL
ncbi:MAG: NAD(P)-dependent oxidoreductase [Proteobacteria bacterium]|nr:NAD(P)-dependent oxidoreductase [Pseudomonadota bacterium]